MMWLEAVYKQDSFVRDKPHHLSLIVVQVDAHVHVLPQPVFQRMCYSSATACFGDSAEACVECFGDEKSGMVCSDDGTRIIFHRDVARGFFTSKYSVKSSTSSFTYRCFGDVPVTPLCIPANVPNLVTNVWEFLNDKKFGMGWIEDDT
ncbi:unnamed protein product [Prunus armeniaca]|uniref:Uncharacterized protein n=1 Tax=Prunus armeniaca TaxID=36596 RepID=A0A6J5WUE5_PRUAR|nr:unnamed protein product [Prunus armeniaca]